MGLAWDPYIKESVVGKGEMRGGVDSGQMEVAWDPYIKESVVGQVR